MNLTADRVTVGKRPDPGTPGEETPAQAKRFSPSLSGQTPRRFTRDGSTALEAELWGTCMDIRAEVQALVPASQMAAFLLGGGYGRGEGGVLRTALGERPYNDLEFYVVVRSRNPFGRRALQARLDELAHRLSPTAGVEVELECISLDQLRQSTPSMFLYDLAVGHKLLSGSDSIWEGCEHLKEPAHIPLSEAARLLMNRCSGLLFSAELLAAKEFTSAHADFAGRNLAKAQLAFGDVLVTTFGQYHSSCVTRHARLRSLSPDRPEFFGEVLEHHRHGVEFKLHPSQTAPDREALSLRHAQLTDLGRRVWLWLESRRLNRRFSSIWEYVSDPMAKCPEKRRWKNYLLHARTFGLRGLFFASASRYPRERLLHALPLLLFDRSTCGEPAVLRVLQSALDTRTADWGGLVRRYRVLWAQFN